MKTIIINVLTVCILALYMVALIQNSLGRRLGIRTRLNANKLVSDIKKRIPRRKKRATEKPTTQTQSNEQEWQQVRYYERNPDTGTFSPINVQDYER